MKKKIPDSAKSKCCNSDFIYSKGFYLGETITVCWNCGKQCELIQPKSITP